jgi:CubicO group peptidase (beta-lactamase class C family)
MNMRKQLVRIKLSLLAVALFGVAASAQGVVATTDVAAKVEKYMNARVDVKGMGGSVMIAKDGQFVVAKGYGLADIEAKTPIYADTKFRIGSITKQFTAASILLLQERGTLNVQDPFCKYLDSCPEAWKPVTIHHLLSMSSGIPSFTSLPSFRELRKKDMKPAESIALVSDQPLKAKPGDVFEYSNTNFIILGMIIEKVSGKTYEQFLTDNILKPLKLKNTGYDHGKERLKLSALGYSQKDGNIVPADVASMMVPYAAGGLYSTTGDLYKWQTALLNGQVFKNAATLDAMLTPNKGDYAYGIIVVKDGKGRKRMAHGGGIEGFVTDAVYFPDEKLFISALVNNDRGGASEVVRSLVAIYFDEPYTVPKKRVEVKVDAALLDAYAGEYQLSPTMTFKITREGGGLVLEPTGQSKSPIFAESETEFFLKVVDASMKFVKDSSGKVTGLDFTQGGRTTNAKKTK